MSAARKRMLPKRATSANNTNLRFPDSPEGVALALAYLIDQDAPASDLIGLYRKCLAVVSGAEHSYGGADSLDRVLH
jgi:hypothetical protein